MCVRDILVNVYIIIFGINLQHTASVSFDKTYTEPFYLKTSRKYVNIYFKFN